MEKRGFITEMDLPLLKKRYHRFWTHC